MDNLKRDRETIDGMIKRSKEQAGEMSPVASSVPVLNSQLKDVVQHLASIDAIKPEIGLSLYFVNGSIFLNASGDRYVFGSEIIRTYS